MKKSPTQLSLKKARDEGYIAQVVEKYNTFAKVRQDLFGIIDVVAVGQGQTIGIQCTSYSNMAARANKIAESYATPHLRDAGWKLEVHGWRKVKGRWQVRIVDVS